MPRLEEELDAENEARAADKLAAELDAENESRSAAASDPLAAELDAENEARSDPSSLAARLTPDFLKRGVAAAGGALGLARMNEEADLAGRPRPRAPRDALAPLREAPESPRGVELPASFALKAAQAPPQAVAREALGETVGPPVQRALESVIGGEAVAAKGRAAALEAAAIPDAPRRGAALARTAVENFADQAPSMARELTQQLAIGPYNIGHAIGETGGEAIAEAIEQPEHDVGGFVSEKAREVADAFGPEERDITGFVADRARAAGAYFGVSEPPATARVSSPAQPQPMPQGQVVELPPNVIQALVAPVLERTGRTVIPRAQQESGEGLGALVPPLKDGELTGITKFVAEPSGYVSDAINVGLAAGLSRSAIRRIQEAAERSLRSADVALDIELGKTRGGRVGSSSQMPTESELARDPILGPKLKPKKLRGELPIVVEGPSNLPGILPVVIPMKREGWRDPVTGVNVDRVLTVNAKDSLVGSEWQKRSAAETITRSLKPKPGPRTPGELENWAAREQAEFDRIKEGVRKSVGELEQAFLKAVRDMPGPARMSDEFVETWGKAAHGATDKLKGLLPESVRRAAARTFRSDRGLDAKVSKIGNDYKVARDELRQVIVKLADEIPKLPPALSERLFKARVFNEFTPDDPDLLKLMDEHDDFFAAMTNLGIHDAALGNIPEITRAWRSQTYMPRYYAAEALNKIAQTARKEGVAGRLKNVVFKRDKGGALRESVTGSRSEALKYGWQEAFDVGVDTDVRKAVLRALEEVGDDIERSRRNRALAAEPKAAVPVSHLLDERDARITQQLAITTARTRGNAQTLDAVLEDLNLRFQVASRELDALQARAPAAVQSPRAPGRSSTPEAMTADALVKQREMKEIAQQWESIVRLKNEGVLTVEDGLKKVEGRFAGIQKEIDDVEKNIDKLSKQNGVQYVRLADALRDMGVRGKMKRIGKNGIQETVDIAEEAALDKGRFGALRGALVNRDLVEDLDLINAPRSNIEKSIAAAVGIWKMSLTALNPRSHVYNQLGNVHTSHMGGYDLRSQPFYDTLGMYHALRRDGVWAGARKAGVELSDAVDDEKLRDVLGTMLDEHSKIKGASPHIVGAGVGALYGGLASARLGGSATLGAAAGAIGGGAIGIDRMRRLIAALPPTKLYQLADDFKRLGFYMDAVTRRGLTPEIAAKEANFWVINSQAGSEFSNLAGSVRWFANWPLKYQGVLARAVQERPLRVAFWYSTPAWMTALAEQTGALEPGEGKRRMSATPPWQQGLLQSFMGEPMLHEEGGLNVPAKAALGGAALGLVGGYMAGGPAGAIEGAVALGTAGGLYASALGVPVTAPRPWLSDHVDKKTGKRIPVNFRLAQLLPGASGGTSQFGVPPLDLAQSMSTQRDPQSGEPLLSPSRTWTRYVSPATEDAAQLWEGMNGTYEDGPGREIDAWEQFARMFLLKQRPQTTKEMENLKKLRKHKMGVKAAVKEMGKTEKFERPLGQVGKEAAGKTR